MAEIYCGVVSESEASSACKPSSRAARRRRIEIRRFKFFAGVAAPSDSAENAEKRKRLVSHTRSVSRDWDTAMEKCGDEVTVSSLTISSKCPSTSAPLLNPDAKFGMVSVCGRRRDMEDAVSIHPSFCGRDQETASNLHYYAVYDGHGCSHVRTSLKHVYGCLVN